MALFNIRPNLSYDSFNIKINSNIWFFILYKVLWPLLVQKRVVVYNNDNNVIPIRPIRIWSKNLYFTILV